MDIIAAFHNHLLRGKKQPSKVTIKNYLADTRRFIEWYEKRFQQTFSPALLTQEITDDYQKDLAKDSFEGKSSASSVKRYISSLRKFVAFLEHSGAIEANPFETTPSVKKVQDPWMIKQFKNYLIVSKASSLTIKNYLIDIQQFLDWLQAVTKDQESLEVENRFLTIDHFAVSQYKNRLINDLKLSPTSVNRKLSSLRKYFRWLTEKGVLRDSSENTSAIKTSIKEVKEKPIITEKPAIVVKPNKKKEELPLTALLALELPEEIQEEKGYAKFAPIRLVQKTKKAIKIGFNTTLLYPIAHSTEAFEYLLWKKNGKEVFTPVTAFLPETKVSEPETDNNTMQSQTVIPTVATKPVEKTSKVPQVTISKAASLKDFINSKTASKPYAIRNFSKAFYAPLKISLTHLPFKERLLHHLRYTRPEWYRTYHSYPIVHHVHLGILLLATTMAGIGIFYTAAENPKEHQKVLASSPNAPPRTLAFNGRLTDNDNAPITAPTALRFSLYNSDTASGAAMLWQEVITVEPDQNGAFTTQLGKKARISQALFKDNPAMYIGMTIADTEELKPRQQLPTTELASDTRSVQGLKPISSDPDQTENVLLSLDSSGDLTIGGKASPTFQALGGEFTLSGQAVALTTIPGSNGNITIAPDGNGIIDLKKPLQNTTDYNNIDITSGAVLVNDELAVVSNSDNRSALFVNQNGSGDIISGYSNGIAKFRVDAAGNALFTGNVLVEGNSIGTTNSSFSIAPRNVTNLSLGSEATVISIGASSGITSINNNLEVQGETTFTKAVTSNGIITAKAGVVISEAQKLTLSDFTPGAITYIDSTKALAQDPQFTWNDTKNTLGVQGSLCITATTTQCAGSAAGTIYAANATVQAADLAENYLSATQLEPGDVVIPEGKNNSLAVSKSTHAYQNQVIGIISTKPGFILNSDATPNESYPYRYPLALQGRVPVKVTSQNGSIKAGDALTSSPIPGVAMKATGSGQIIGKALESYDGSTTAVGKVMVFVNITHQLSPTTITASGDMSGIVGSGSATTIAYEHLSEDTLTSITKNVINSLSKSKETLEKVATGSLQVISENVTIGGQQLKDYIVMIVNETMAPYLESIENNYAKTSEVPVIATESALLSTAIPSEPSFDLGSISSSSGKMFGIADQIATSAGTWDVPDASTSALTETLAIASESGAVASESGTIATTETRIETASFDYRAFEERLDFLEASMAILSHEASSAAEIGIEDAEISKEIFEKDVTFLGRTVLTDVGITGTLTMGTLSFNGLTEDGSATINTSTAPLKLQAHGLHGLDIMDGKLVVDTKGNLEVNGSAVFAKDVTVKGKLAANIIAPVPGSDLAIQNRQGNDVVAINEKGNISASGTGQFAKAVESKEGSFGGLKIVRGVQADASKTVTHAEGSAGKGTIKAHEIERTIYTPYVTEDSLIYVTPTSNTQNVAPYVARQIIANPVKGIEGSFTIQIPYELAKDVSFNWWIVN